VNPINIKEIIQNALDALKRLYADEPERVNSAVLAGVVAVAAAVGVVINPLTTAGVVALVLGILLKGEVTRQRVTPAKKADARVAAAKRAPKKRR
jgi:hypothetical protein